jgi:hypothetical protein
MRKQDWVWQCELCAHKWIAVGIDPPAQCPKCRKRNWHIREVILEGQKPEQAAKPDISFLRQICDKPRLERTHPVEMPETFPEDELIYVRDEWSQE